MRKITVGLGLLAALMTSQIAGAADMRVKAPPPPPPPPPFSWTGFYIGGDFGGAWANGSVTDLFGLSASASRSGFIGGGVVGFNYQITNIVWGVEGNFDWTSLSTTGTGVFVPGFGVLQASADTNWVSTLAGRLGVTSQMFFGNQSLFYIKGGGAWVRNTATITNLTTGGALSASNTNNGWVIGGGIEWAFGTNWSAKIEYDYLALRSWTFNSVVLFPGDTFSVSRNIQEFKIGINYRLGGWGSPVVAKY
jgi:outer membrane immunogenic protein